MKSEEALKEQKKSAAIWSGSKADWVTVEIPDETFLGDHHPMIHLNERSFAPGKHLVPSSVAEELIKRIQIKATQDRRLLQDHPDHRAQGIVDRWGWTGPGVPIKG